MKFAFASALMTAVFLFSAESSHAGALEKELARLIVEHPNIRAGRKSVEATRQDIDIKRAAFFPTVTATGETGVEYIDSPAERAKRDNDKVWLNTKKVAGLTITQNLFNGYETTTQVKMARMNKAISELSLEGTIQNTLFEGINAYIDVLRQKRLIELARQNETTIVRQLNLEDERVQRGSGIAVDVLQAKSRLQIAKERRITFEGALEDAISRYFQIFNRPPDLDSMTDPIPPVEMIPSELAKAIDIAKRENPAVSNANATTEVARERQSIFRAEYYPTFDLVGAWNYERDNNGVPDTRRDYSMTLRSTWDLFSGFSTKAELAKAAYEYRASKDNHEYVIRKIAEQTKLAWQALITSRRRLELLENAVNIAAEVFQSRKRLREAGKETVINVLDAENEINNAQINYIAASYDERTAAYQLLQAMGRLSTTYLALELP